VVYMEGGGELRFQINFRIWIITQNEVPVVKYIDYHDRQNLSTLKVQEPFISENVFCGVC
jgi:hypothetical protein